MIWNKNFIYRDIFFTAELIFIILILFTFEHIIEKF